MVDWLFFRVASSAAQVPVFAPCVGVACDQDHSFGGLDLALLGWEGGKRDGKGREKREQAGGNHKCHEVKRSETKSFCFFESCLFLRRWR